MCGSCWGFHRGRLPCESLLFAEIINSRSKVLFCRKKKKQRKKNFFFGFVPFAKMGSAKKIAKKNTGTGLTIEAKVMKNHGNGKYDIQFQQDGNSVVRLSVPRAKLQIA